MSEGRSGLLDIRATPAALTHGLTGEYRAGSVSEPSCFVSCLQRPIASSYGDCRLLLRMLPSQASEPIVPRLRVLRFDEYTGDIGFRAFDGGLDATDATFDLHGSKAIPKLDAEGGNDLIRAQLHCDHTIGVQHVVIVRRDPQDRLPLVWMCRLSNEQLLRFAGEQQRRHEQYDRDTNRSSSVEPGHVPHVRRRDSHRCDQEAEERGGVLEKYRERSGVLAVAKGFEKALLPLIRAKGL